MDIQAFKELHKFGGTNFATMAAFNQAISLVDFSQNQLIIISALGRTTANLQELLEIATRGEDYQSQLLLVLEFHQRLSTELFKSSEIFNEYAADDIYFLKQSLDSISQNRYVDNKTKDKILSLGEYWSCFLFSSYCKNNFTFLDASKILVVDREDEVCTVNWSVTQKNLERFLEETQLSNIIITGFIAQNTKGEITTLGFEGSDFSASIFGKLFNVQSITLWTNVDGIFTADPRLVKQAKIIKELSYLEAIELSYLGGSILHPQAIEPAMEAKIPIFIKNGVEKFKYHTIISAKRERSQPSVCAINLLENISLVNIEASATLSSSLLASTIFNALSDIKVPVFLTTQASSSHSICIAVKSADLPQTLSHLKLILKTEIELNNIKSIIETVDCSMLAIIGDAMVGKAGYCSKLLECLAKSNINVLALSQGSNERNISVVVSSENALKAINVVHAGFYLSKRQLQIALIGPGNVGKVFLQQILDNKTRIEESLEVCLVVNMIASSKKVVMRNCLGSVNRLMDELKKSELTFDIKKSIQYLKEKDYSHTVIIDCTSSEYISDFYQEFIQNDFHVITPNKKVTSGAFVRFDEVKKLCLKNKRHFLYETNVCAGLPVIKTLQDLISTGDVVFSIQGVFSGTLSYLFNQVNNGSSFSEALSSAYNKGLTEPDPREDLNGLDVARKCVCLAREMGFLTELSEVTIVPILPEELMAGSLEEFLSKGEAMDEVFNKHISTLTKPANKLVYSGSITKQGKIVLAIEEVGSLSPFYRLQGTDNMIIFHTQRYDEYPLIVQGPGAGADVTAAGVFADLLRLVSLTSGGEIYAEK